MKKEKYDRQLNDRVTSIHVNKNTIGDLVSYFSIIRLLESICCPYWYKFLPCFVKTIKWTSIVAFLERTNIPIIMEYNLVQGTASIMVLSAWIVSEFWTQHRSFTVSHNKKSKSVKWQLQGGQLTSPRRRIENSLCKRFIVAWAVMYVPPYCMN